MNRHSRLSTGRRVKTKAVGRKEIINAIITLSQPLQTGFECLAYVGFYISVDLSTDDLISVKKALWRFCQMFKPPYNCLPMLLSRSLGRRISGNAPVKLISELARRVATFLPFRKQGRPYPLLLPSYYCLLSACFAAGFLK